MNEFLAVFNLVSDYKSFWGLGIFSQDIQCLPDFVNLRRVPKDELGLRGAQLAADLEGGVAGVGGAHGEAEVEAAEDDGGVLEAVGEDNTDHITLAKPECYQGSGNLECLLSDLKIRTWDWNLD